MSLRHLKSVGFIYVPERRRRDASNRSISLTYKLWRHDDALAWSTNVSIYMRPKWDVATTLHTGWVRRPLLETNIPSKHFVCLQDVLRTSWRHVFKTSSKYVVKTPSRRLQCNNFLSSKMSSRRLAKCLQDVFKTNSRRLKDVFEEEKLLR